MKTMARFILTVAVLCALSSGFAVGHETVVVTGPEKSRFGIDYVFPLDPFYQNEKWARQFSALNARWVNFAEVSWRRLEPRKPFRSVHTYVWKDLDRMVKWWQKYDFRIVLTLRLEDGWFSGPLKYRPDPGFTLPGIFWKNTDRLPAAEHLPSYRAWIGALVERYDGDGKEDMPGLLYPILHYQVGNEYANPMFWTGTLEDYETLLKEACQAAKAACPEAVIISNGIRWNDLFHNDRSGAQFEKRFARFLERSHKGEVKEIWKRARAFTEKTVALAPYYDILDAGGNGPYPTMSAGYMAWVRRELAKTKLSRVIWDMEARCEPQIAVIESARFHAELEVPGGARILRALRNPSDPLHSRGSEWYRAEQARVLTQVFITRFAAGFEKVFMGMPNDWDRMPAALSASNPYMGLADRDGKPWPAFFAMKLLVNKLDGFTGAEKVSSEKDIELYRFTFRGMKRTIWAAWLLERRTRGMEDPLPVRKVCLTKIKERVKIWTIPTSGKEGAPLDRKPTRGGLMMELSPTPVLIETLD